MSCLQQLIMLLTIVIKLFTLEFMRRAVTDEFPSGVIAIVIIIIK